MATWKTDRKFEFDYALQDNTTEPFYTWEYATVTDTLTLLKNIPAGRDAYYPSEMMENRTEAVFLGDSEAEALYCCLRDWIAAYRGEDMLKRIDAREDAMQHTVRSLRSNESLQQNE